MKKKVWKFSNISTAGTRIVSSHWLLPDLDAPGSCLFSDDLIIIVLKDRKANTNGSFKIDGMKVTYLFQCNLIFLYFCHLHFMFLVVVVSNSQT